MAPVTSLRDRLNAKPRRRVTVRVQVTDPGSDGAAVDQARTLWLAAQADGSDPTRIAELRGAVEDAEATLEQHYADVEFQAISSPDLEALTVEHQTQDGEPDLDALIPNLCALCAVDESLQDVAWWAEFMGSTRLSPGEAQHIRREVFWGLHYPPIRTSTPKG